MIMSKYRIAFIVPYFGSFPNYFELWLESCKWNRTIDFLIFTDDTTHHNYSPNVKFFYMTFSEIKALFQAKYDFELKISAPYKFCDFRPAYGEIFSEFLRDYDYWGHCDIDLIWGNIRNFITDDILSYYQRVFSRGHCSLYKNSPEVNAWYRNLPTHGCQDWKDVFQSENSCCFDEWAGHCGGGISQILASNNIEIYDEVCSADINVKRGDFSINRMPDYKNLYFYCKDGSLLIKSDSVCKEVLCAHFQKRKVVIDRNIDISNFYFVAPNLFTSDQYEIRPHFVREKMYETTKIIDYITKKLR